MKVILLEELRGKGGEGDVVDVAAGFANNYLFRQGIAVKATKGNLKQLEQRRKSIEKREEVRLTNARSLQEKLDGATIEIRVRVGEEGQLFGSITSQMIVGAVAAQVDLELDRRRIELPKPIKATGEHAVTYSVYRDIKSTINLIVIDEAAANVQADNTTAEAEQNAAVLEAPEDSEVVVEDGEAAE